MNRRGLENLYLVACAVLVTALALVSVLVVHETRERARATADALYHEDIRTALWRMETRVGAMVATTTVRVGAPKASGSYSNIAIAPQSNELNDLAPPSGALRDEIVEAADSAFLIACEFGMTDEPPVSQRWNSAVASPQGVPRGSQRSQVEFQARRAMVNSAQVVQGNRDVEGAGAWTMGPLAPVWTDDEDGLELYLARRVETDSGVQHESYRVPWSELEALLLAEIADLFPEARLAPLTDPGSIRVLDAAHTEPTVDDAFRLAAIPVRLEAPSNVEPQVALMPLAILGTGWVALLAGLGLGWVALRSSIAYGDKHRRFTHAVTHELRTPLTTFRMYSEMLARGMVPEASRAEYLATLESESLRLSGLVENVLRYAQLEEGALDVQREEFDGRSLIARLEPGLVAICGRSGAVLSVEVADSAGFRRSTDAGAIGQILGNLVENACKYGGLGDEPPVLKITVQDVNGHLCIDVSDAGPGIPPAMAARIFEPFERAGRDSSDHASGVGLGLALSRDLAQSLGGDLVLLPGNEGATFRLTL